MEAFIWKCSFRFLEINSKILLKLVCSSGLILFVLFTLPSEVVKIRSTEIRLSDKRMSLEFIHSSQMNKKRLNCSNVKYQLKIRPSFGTKQLDKHSIIELRPESKICKTKVVYIKHSPLQE